MGFRCLENEVHTPHTDTPSDCARSQPHFPPASCTGQRPVPIASRFPSSASGPFPALSPNSSALLGPMQMPPPSAPPLNAPTEFHSLSSFGAESVLHPPTLYLDPSSSIHSFLYYILVIAAPILSLLVDLTLKSGPVNASHVSRLGLPRQKTTHRA